MKRVLLGLLLVVLVVGAWALYRVGYIRGFVVAQRIGYQQQVNDALLLLLSRQKMLASEPSVGRCEIEALVNSQLTLLAVEESGLQRGITWRDILQGVGQLESQAKKMTVPTVDQIRRKFNVRDDVPPEC
jgi:hypothetical protein